VFADWLKPVTQLVREVAKIGVIAAVGFPYGSWFERPEPAAAKFSLLFESSGAYSLFGAFELPFAEPARCT
jgi:hypothetical protein